MEVSDTISTRKYFGINTVVKIRLVPDFHPGLIVVRALVAIGHVIF